MDALGTTLELAYTFATSLALGLLMGLERQRHATLHAGVRTFALVAVLGTAAALIAQAASFIWMIGIGFVLVGALTAMLARLSSSTDEVPGATTLVALLLCYVLGVMVWYGHAQLAVALAIVITIVLHYKPTLHRIAGRLSEQDLNSILQFAVLSFVVLPLLPDVSYGPFAALNPYRIWLMVVLVSGISLLGYIALKFGEPRKSAWFVGIAGGLVSSTATTLAYARETGKAIENAHTAARMIVIANLVMLVRVAIISTAVAPTVARQLGEMLVVPMVLGLIGLGWLQRYGVAPTDSAQPALSNPASLTSAIGFGAIYATVLFLLAWVTHLGLSWGSYSIAFLSGLTDVDAITISNLQLFGAGKVLLPVAFGSILIALTANVLLKLAIAGVIGNFALFKKCAPSMLATLIGLIMSFWWLR